MSEIPFVKALGDAVERAAAERIATRRRRLRRRVSGGVLAFAVAATGVAAASGVFDSPVQLATSGVGCYGKADLQHADVTVISAGDETPVAACRRVLGAGPLVACVEASVLVFPGGPDTCRRLGLAPLPASYAPAKARVNRLARRIMALERSADCWAPDELAARVQALLDRSPAWRGWTAAIDRRFVQGPCGVVSHFNGDGSRSVDGSFDATKRIVSVTLATSRSTMRLLFTADAPGNHLIDASGERCYTPAGLEALVRSGLPAGDRELRFDVEPPPEESEIADARQRRLDEGCVVIVGFTPTQDDRAIVVEIWE